MQESGLVEITPWIGFLPQGQYPAALPPESLQCAVRAATAANGLVSKHLLIWQATFFIHVSLQ